MSNLLGIDLIQLMGMKNLMLESDLIKLEESGIEIDHKSTLSIDEVVDIELFEHDLRSQAKKMAPLFILYYCLENTIRRLITSRLSERHGPNWWDLHVPNGVQEAVKTKQEKEKDTPFNVRSEEPITYTNFGELINIIESNWDDFADTIRSRKVMQQTLSQLNGLRNIIAHSCELKEDDLTRYELLIRDWLRITS